MNNYELASFMAIVGAETSFDSNNGFPCILFKFFYAQNNYFWAQIFKINIKITKLGTIERYLANKATKEYKACPNCDKCSYNSNGKVCKTKDHI